MIRSTIALAFTLALALTPWASLQAVDAAHREKAQQSIAKGIAFLRGTQNPDGAWTPQPGPAITAMVLAALLDQPGASLEDPALSKALAFVLSKVKADGGIHDGILENYNTAICLSALSRLKDRPDVAPVIKNAQDYLRNLQWSTQHDPKGNPVNEDHAYFGGAGYGKHGRPDLSNTQIMLEGLYDSGLDCNDPAFKRALVFISRLQGVPTNKELGDKIEQDGGFIYATSVNEDLIGVPQSMASPEMEERAKAGQTVSSLRTYGSMTYAGFKSYLYAALQRDDPRVVAAYEWIKHNYTLERNPGLSDAQKMQGYFYYLHTFSRALRAWNSDVIETASGEKRLWAQDLITQLASLQNPDGSWTNDADRWMEGDPNLVTAYALNALTHALR